MIEQVRNQVRKMGGSFESADEHVRIRIEKNGDMVCIYDPMPGYAVPSSRDRYVRIPAGRVKKKTNMKVMREHGWLFSSPTRLAELGL